MDLKWFWDIYNYDIHGIEVGPVIVAFLFVLAGFVLKFILTAVLNRLARAAEKTRFALDDVLLKALARPVGWGAVLAGVYFALTMFTLPTDPVDFPKFANALARGLSVLLIVWFALRLLNGIADYWMAKAEKTDTKLDDQLIPIARSSGRVFLILFGAVLFLQNIGYSVGSLLAGIGIGGAAIAFASKDVLSNLFGSIVIFFDRPFHIGDWIVVGGVEGTVETVGLRTTKVRTFANSLVTVPNQLFTTTPINNWSRMEKRRIKTHVTLSYGTTPEQMEQAVGRIRGLIENDDNFRHDFFLVHFVAMEAYSLNILIYCFTVTTKWGEWMAIREKFYLDIMRAMADIGVEFAFPTQTVHIEGLPENLPGKGKDIEGVNLP